MTLNELLTNSEEFTDETLSDASAIIYANKAVAILNTEVGLKLPKYTSVSTAYTALPDDWQLRLILPYIAYGVKIKDTSLEEAQRHESEFYAALASFKEAYVYEIDAIYMKDNSTNIYQSKKRNINTGWFRG